MAKDPAFLFYPNDWLGGTMGMTFEEKGAYMELLMLQFNRGHMTKHMIGRTVGQLWDNIQDKFVKDGEGRYFNERLEDEQTKRKRYSESRRNNKKGINQHTKKPSGHMTSHMENVNEDKDVIKSKDRIPLLETFIAYGREQASKQKVKVTDISLTSKYDAWIENGWVNGFGEPIKRWRSSLINSIKHMAEKPDPNGTVPFVPRPFR